MTKSQNGVSFFFQTIGISEIVLRGTGGKVGGILIVRIFVEKLFLKINENIGGTKTTIIIDTDHSILSFVPTLSR